MTTYAVFTVRFGEHVASHHGIFVQTNEDGCGTLYDVRGAVSANGRLVFKCNQERLSRFKFADAKGVIKKDHVPELERICRSVAAPDSQYPASSETGYAVPACRCGEWTSQAWAAVSASGIVKA
ncbi:hypothetical protein EsDP_00006298 [Epichloe bromicola]|uniref:LRAT domain-containing protein n=1 Tax=Epichloe bromicola TaxID=79588 RepID=A0ABQ0CX92_9HYPO